MRRECGMERRQKGFTLLEVLLSVALIASVMFTLVEMQSAAGRFGNDNQGRDLLHSDFRRAVDRMIQDLDGAISFTVKQNGVPITSGRGNEVDFTTATGATGVLLITTAQPSGWQLKETWNGNAVFAIPNIDPAQSYFSPDPNGYSVDITLQSVSLNQLPPFVIQTVVTPRTGL
jgi:prepilin-type N-terminal cleavage/methylation domain-containing protein